MIFINNHKEHHNNQCCDGRSDKYSIEEMNGIDDTAPTYKSLTCDKTCVSLHGIKSIENKF